MSPLQIQAALVILAALLAVVSAAAGVLWARCRSLPTLRVAQLARELAERQRTLEELIGRLEARLARPGRPGFGAARDMAPEAAPDRGRVRADRGHDGGSPSTRMTLISVPDLSTPPAAPGPLVAPVASELAQRFGSIWKLADEGATADAIARLTGQPIGQIHLILGLRRQRASTTETPT